MRKTLAVSFIIFIFFTFISCCENNTHISKTQSVLSEETTIKTSISVAEPKIYQKGYISKNFAPIYSFPDKESEILTEVFLGQALDIIAKINSWYSINFDNELAYIEIDNISFTEPNNSIGTLKTKGKYFIENVPIISQMPDFPTGCESVSAVMALNYFEKDITVADFVDNYLDKSFKFYTKDGVLYGPDPYEVYVGDPRVENSYGCMAPVIEKALNKYLEGSMSVKRYVGVPLQDLCAKYVDNDIPVLVWVTIAMIESFDSTQWETENNGRFIWPGNEHCMLLVGYDKNYYYMNDPYKNAMLLYPRSKTETRYSELGSQAIVIEA